MDLERLERLERSLAGLPRPTAPPEFRDRLRRQFLGEAAPAPSRAGVAAPRRHPLRSAAWAAAAIAALLVLGWRLNAGPSWTLTAASGSGTIEVDGRPVALDSRAELARALKPGARVRVPEGAQLDLELPGVALFQIAGGSDATLPGRPGRWFGRTLAASLEAGEVRIATGPAFRGKRFDVSTPEARAVVTGTTLAVFRLPDSSCVCVFEGEVAMLGGAQDDTVRAGTRRSVYRDGRAPLLEPIRPMETMKLSMLRDQAAQAFER